MQQKKIYIQYGLFLLLGIGVGILIGGRRMGHHDQLVGHRMPDGSMMEGHMDMASMMMDMNAALRGKTGDAFDKAFIAEMIVHHQGAIDMAQLALTSAKHAEIKNLSQAIISAQTAEIEQMKQWQKAWYTN
jgi:uncharacterized protein (DUF305 family)